MILTIFSLPFQVGLSDTLLLYREQAHSQKICDPVCNPWLEVLFKKLLSFREPFAKIQKHFCIFVLKENLVPSNLVHSAVKGQTSRQALMVKAGCLLEYPKSL